MKNCWITLGAYGDCCNTLPLVWDDFQKGNQPTFMIARQFQDLLDGVTYCNRLVWDGHYSESAAAADCAQFHQHKESFDNVYLVQCFGTNVERQTESYAKESWRLVGMMDRWGKLPLVFDNRNTEREGRFLEDFITDIKEVKPIVLVSMEGKSSPWPHPKLLVDSLKPLMGKVNVIFLDGLRAPKFYDMLPILEAADCLICADSGLLHLSYAVPKLPVIALITDRPDHWHGSPKRPNQFSRIRYGVFPELANQIPRLVVDAMESSKRYQPRLIHVWSDYSHRNQGAMRRHALARNTWKVEYSSGNWFPAGIHERDMSRNGQSIGENKPVPFVKDLFNMVADRAKPKDILVFSNDDTCFAPGITQVIIDNVGTHGAMWGNRWEHVGPLKQMLTKTQMVSQAAYRHCGSDIFAFTAQWWDDHQDGFPDFLLTFEVWDLVLKKYILMTGGVQVPDTCYHEAHSSFWHLPENRECVGNVYNRGLAQQWLAHHGIQWQDAFK